MDDITAGGVGEESGAAPESSTRTPSRSRRRRAEPALATASPAEGNQLSLPGLEPEPSAAVNEPVGSETPGAGSAVPGLEAEAPAAPAAPSRGRRKATSRAAAAPAEPAEPAGEPASVAPAKRSRRRATATRTAPETVAAEPEPISAESIGAEPISAEPVDEEPSAPPLGEALVSEEPAAGEIVGEEPVDEPVDEEAVSEEAVEEPVDEEAVSEEAVEEPASTEPVAPAAPPAPRLAPSTALLFMAPSPEPVRAEPTLEPELGRPGRRSRRDRRGAEPMGEVPAIDLEPEEEPPTSRSRRGRRARAAEPALPEAEEPTAVEPVAEPEFGEGEGEGEEDLETTARRRRRRGRRGRGRGRGVEAEEAEAGAPEAEGEEGPGEEEPLTRRRRRRRRGSAGAETETVSEDGVVTVVRVRAPRDEVQGVTGSTRLEAKRQRRRDGREQRRTRPPILTEAEFLARREAVDRVMVVRQRGDRTQVAVLEDGILVEHYVARQSATTMVGNVYLGKVQNVLPSMEAAFVDIGRGRNAVLYAGEVNWDATGLEGRARSIEQALKSGDSVLVQVTKDPVGHKGARLTSHIALSGRHLVYVPNGHASGISRKLSDVERRRLRDILKNLVPEGAGVIVRTAAEGASEEDLARDVKRLQAQWDDIQAKAAAGGAPALLSAEPDLVIRVVRDLFNEDFREIVIQGSEAHDQVEQYLANVSPDLVSRVRQHTGPTDVFAEWRIDEQILKGLDRRVFLPSGGHLVIDRTEAMTVIDVNTGKYTGAGGNLEETVTRNNLEAAEEIVRQLRLRDIGGIVVIDFIDMVLESNRELVLRRLTECLGRDRTKHQVTEITSLGLVQMTRKRIGQGLLEAFSETCDHCKGRGVIIQTDPVPERPRPNVAEKVRAVAASTRLAAAEAPGRVPTNADDANLAEVALADAGLSNGVADGGLTDVDAEPALPAADVNGAVADIDTDEVSDAADLALELATAGESGETEGEPASARRRGRRGNGRRRTRP